MLLDDAAQRTRAELLVIALFRQPRRRGFGQFEADTAIGELGFELQHELLHDPADNRLRQPRERDDRIETVAEFGREQFLDRRQILAFTLAAPEADGFLGSVGGARIGGHDQNHVAAVDLLAVRVRDLAVIHDLQQDVEDVRVGLLDLVEQQDRMGVLVDRVGQQAALIVADIARRCADQTADRVTLHVLGHVEAQQLHAQDGGELTGNLGLADPGRAGEEVAADRLVRLAQTGPSELDRAGQLADCLVLAVHDPFQVGIQALQRRLVRLGNRFRRYAGHLRDDRLHILHADRLLALGRSDQAGRCPGLVDHVDRLVGQFAVAHVAVRQLHGRLQRIVGEADIVEILEIGLQPLQNLDRIGHRGLDHVDLLETARQRAILLEVLSVLLVRRGAHAAQPTRLQRGLQQVGGIHRPARGRACTDHGVDLVDEQNGVRLGFERLDHLFHAFLEIAAIAGSGQQSAHVEGVDHRL